MIVLNAKLCLFVTVVVNVAGFYSRQSPYIHHNTKTHWDITNSGCLNAISRYILEKKLTDEKSPHQAFQKFFESDSTGRSKLFKTIGTIRNAVADTQETKRDLAYVHCHADQIKLAHNKVITCKDGLFLRKNNLEELRKHLGECLYTVQSFYSNTNWVEMRGPLPYLSFGARGKQLMAIATPGENTCIDMASIHKDCKNNLIPKDKLTSGYHHGRGNTKPPRPIGTKEGKCSHGGPDDESRKLIAKCGINKDAPFEHLSPHYHLHNDAYRAAVDATEEFLINNETGVLSLLGEETFRRLFHIKRRRPVSLSFAVDYTGSMSEEIAAVKLRITELVTSTIGSDNEPTDYVLSLFSDPARLNKVHVYTNGYDIIDKISAVKVDGGDDCPELAAAGILNAIKWSRPYSTVLVFTDADAKDDDRLDEVLSAAKAKNISITSLLSSQCSRRRRDTRDRRRRDTTSFFESLASATGGSVHKTNKADIGTVLKDVLQNVFPTSEVVIESYVWKSSVLNDKIVAVDSTIQVLKISVKGANSKNDADLFYPNGTKEHFTSVVAKKLYTSKGEIIMTLQKPRGGIFTLRRNRNKNLSIVITAQTSVQMEAELFENTVNGALVTMTGSPVTGNNYTYIATIYNLQNGTCSTVTIVKTSGEQLSSFTLQQVVSDIDIVCSADVVIPVEEFLMEIIGTDNLGYQFRRRMPTVYEPSNVELIITDSNDDAPIRQRRELPYTIVNYAKTMATYTVTISDETLFAIRPKTRRHFIPAGESVEGSFVLLPTRPVGMLRYTVTLTHNSSIKQKITKSILVTTVMHPVCKIMSTTGQCDLPSLNTANCSKYSWSSVGQVDYIGTRLESITSSVGDVITLKYANFSGTMNGPLLVNISGDCCTPSVHVNIFDVHGHFSQCHLEFSGGRLVESVDPVANSSAAENVMVYSKTHAIITAVAVFVGILFVIIIAALVTNYRMRSKTEPLVDRFSYKRQISDRSEKE